MEYENSSTKVKIICHEHGIFEQTPNGHLSGRGCRKCYFGNMNLSTDDFIFKSRD